MFLVLSRENNDQDISPISGHWNYCLSTPKSNFLGRKDKKWAISKWWPLRRIKMAFIWSSPKSRRFEVWTEQQSPKLHSMNAQQTLDESSILLKSTISPGLWRHKENKSCRHAWVGLIKMAAMIKTEHVLLAFLPFSRGNWNFISPVPTSLLSIKDVHIHLPK